VALIAEMIVNIFLKDENYFWELATYQTRRFVTFRVLNELAFQLFVRGNSHQMHKLPVDTGDAKRA